MLVLRLNCMLFYEYLRLSFLRMGECGVLSLFSGEIDFTLV